MSPLLKSLREFLKKSPSPNLREDSLRMILKTWSEKPRLLKVKMKKSLKESKPKMDWSPWPTKSKINLMMKKSKQPLKKLINKPSPPRLMKPSSGLSLTNKLIHKHLKIKPKNLKMYSTLS
jgi:hypothetical protein